MNRDEKIHRDEKILKKKKATSEPNLRAHLKDQILGGSGIYQRQRFSICTYINVVHHLKKFIII